MLEEQGQGLVTGSIKKLLKFLGSNIWRGVVSVDSQAYNKAAQKRQETGKKSVQELVRKGRDLKLSEVIEDKRQFTDFCKNCQKEGLAFAVKPEKDGGYRLLYQSKDAVLVEQTYKKTISKEYKQPKIDLVELLKRNTKLMDKVNTQEQNKQREDRTR